MADLDGRNRIPIWVWVLIAVILAGVIFYVATRPPPAPERADVATNEMMVDDPFTAEPVQPVGPVLPVEPVEPVEPVTPTENAIENAQ